MSIPNHVMALATHKGAAIVHAGGRMIPVKIMDIESECTPIHSQTTFKCLVVDSCDAKSALNSVYCREGSYLSDRYNQPTTPQNLTGLLDPKKIAADFASAVKAAYGVFEIDRVIFNDPATIVFWKDGTKTVVKCQEGDTYSPESGLAIAIAKKALGNKGNFNDVFKKHIPNY